MRISKKRMIENRKFLALAGLRYETLPIEK